MNPVSTKKRLTLRLTPIALGILAACGGGGGTSVADGGIRGTGSSVGPVSGFGSVFVNGVKFETRDIVNQRVESNDEISTEGDLEKGMILRIEGKWNKDGSGNAEALKYDDTFRGPVTDIVVPDESTGTPGSFRVLGQTISYDRRTVVRVKDGNLTEGMTVRVSAWRTADGYRASFIGSATTGSDFPLELEGRIDEVQLDKFRIGDQWIRGGQGVSYPGDLTINDIVKGALVEVEGRFLSEGGDVTAAEIRYSDDRRFLREEGGEIEMTGPVQSLNVSGSTFSLNGVQVDYDNETEFDDFARSRIADGLLVQVEGEIRTGRLYAEEIDLFEGNAEVEAGVLSPFEGSAENELNVGGVRVRITNNTLIDRDDDDQTPLSEANFLEVEGIEREDANGTFFLEALNIEIESEDSGEYELTGQLTADDPNSRKLTVLGVEITYDQNVGSENEGWRDCAVVSVEYQKVTDGFQAIGIECDD
ncbi:hypothetical protein DOQ08_01573 [Marinobacter litoralis]|uniref:DUF5666 domain-containing protein n=1 Tax=Marinobacter litoralis TaxID=187981 RepID=A0A3M2RG04_9GAMM|nr:DUF5666 domain-containing protein [Marinobacter litoralis]RMJ04253.1 hypothetical protein DOQ08_01573 [Marinobacter litoralis]